MAIGFADLADEEHWGTRAVIYGAISYAAATIFHLIDGLLTRKSPHNMITQPAMQ